MLKEDSKVIDLKTREPWRIEQHEPSDAQRIEMFVEQCTDQVFFQMIKIKEVAGLDMALKALHKMATDIKGYGKKQ